MIDLQRGDVVMVDYPFGEGLGSKERPAVIVQCDADIRRLGTILVAMVTSKTNLAGREPRHVFIDINSADGRDTGLWMNSVVNCTQLAALKKDRFSKLLGSLPDRLMEAVSNGLRGTLDL